jgi:hypothetical protein
MLLRTPAAGTSARMADAPQGSEFFVRLAASRIGARMTAVRGHRGRKPASATADASEVARPARVVHVLARWPGTPLTAPDQGGGPGAAREGQAADHRVGPSTTDCPP